VNSSKIVDDSIVNADINSAAAIALSKLASGTSIVTSLTTPSGSNANGGSISANVLTLSLADATNPGLLTATAQTIAGVKTFTGSALFNANTTLGDAVGDSLTFNAGTWSIPNATTASVSSTLNFDSNTLVID